MRKAIVFGLFLLASAFPRTAGAAGPEVIRFGVCLSMTGEFQDIGYLGLAGINLFLIDYNSRTDETGIRLEILLRDDKSSPAEAAAIVEQMAAEEIQAIVGPMTSGIMRAMIPKAKAHKMVLISPTATNPGIGRKDDWSFRVLFDDITQGRALAKFFLGQMDVKTAAVMINDVHGYGEPMFQAFEKTFTEGGGRIVAVEHYEWHLKEGEVPDFTGILATIQRAEPEVVLLPGYSEEASAIILQSQLVDFNPIFCGGDAWRNKKIILTSGNNVDDSYYVGETDIYADSPPTLRFAELYDRSNDPHIEPLSINSYDAMLLLAEAYGTGARTGEQIRDALYALKDFPLAGGIISFDENSGTKKTLFIHRISRMGDEFISELIAEMKPE